MTVRKLIELLSHVDLDAQVLDVDSSPICVVFHGHKNDRYVRLKSWGDLYHKDILKTHIESAIDSVKPYDRKEVLRTFMSDIRILGIQLTKDEAQYIEGKLDHMESLLSAKED